MPFVPIMHSFCTFRGTPRPAKFSSKVLSALAGADRTRLLTESEFGNAVMVVLSILAALYPPLVMFTLWLDDGSVARDQEEDESQRALPGLIQLLITWAGAVHATPTMQETSSDLIHVSIVVRTRWRRTFVGDRIWGH